ncbi:MAG: hypothetical protein ACLVKA_07190 [Collinsella aerofaciens]
MLPKFDLFIEQTKDIWKDMLDIRKRFRAARRGARQEVRPGPYTMFIGPALPAGRDHPVLDVHPEEMQWKRTRYITSADFFHGTLELVEPGVPVFLFMGEDENRKLDERARAFLTRGVTGDTDINIIDTAEFAIPGLDDEFRVIVSRGF